ncbi:hypothetical protein AHAS_Ahas16G0084600 [Arachis hypogaea]
MARKKIREYQSKRLLKDHLSRLASINLEIQSAQVTESTDFTELTNQHPWLSSTKLVVKPDMLFGKRGKSGLVALNLDIAQVADFVKARLGVEVDIAGCKAPITTFIVEPFVPHDQEFYLSIVSERLGSAISFSDSGGIEIEENWDKVKTIFLPTEKPMTPEACAPLIATLPLEIRGTIGKFIIGVFAVFQDLDFSFLEMNPFTLVNDKPYPLDMRGELDDTAAFKNFNKWGNIEFPLPFGRVLSPTESFIHSLDEKTSASLKFTILNPKGRIWTMVAGGGASVIYADTVGDLGYASELGNYAEYSGAPNEEEVLQYARVVIDCATAEPDGRKRALLIGGGIANFTDVAATFSGIIRALKEKETKLKAARMHIYVRRGGPNYQAGLAKMRALGEELGLPIQLKCDSYDVRKKSNQSLYFIIFSENGFYLVKVAWGFWIMDTFLFTSESVNEGHPDKLCDQISDAVLDACLEQDPESKVACETCTKTNLVMVFGEITTKANVDYEKIVRDTCRGIGFVSDDVGLDADNCNVLVYLEQQSPDIAQGVHGNLTKRPEEIGAGDQGHMFGYATDETPEFMPLSHVLATQLGARLTEVRKNGTCTWLRPDGKTQVTVEYYNDNGAMVPVRVHTVLISTQHDETVTNDEIAADLKEHVIKHVIPEKYLDEKTIFHLNPSGRFVIGGPHGDAGLTGRKIIVDTYGGWGAHGGGAFSGKDPTKVDRSGAYIARQAAKSIVASGIARRCIVQISYAIGVPDPLSVFIDTYGTGKVPDREILKIVKENFDFRPGMISNDLDLKRGGNGRFLKTAAYGHFGRDDPDFTWEIVKPLHWEKPQE